MIKRLGIITLLTLLSISVFARLGGAGDDDYSSSSSDSYESSSSSYDSDNDYGSSSGGGGGGGPMNPVVGVIFGIFIGVLLLMGFVEFLKQTYQKAFRKSIDRKKAKKDLAKCMDRDYFKGEMLQTFFGNGTEREFKEKIQKAFYELQTAWEEQSLDKCRRYLSDGIYQKFQSQIGMMKQLQLFNVLESIQMNRLEIVHHYQEEDFLILDVAVGAVISDGYYSKKYSQLYSKSYETFTEYYTFIKKVNTKGDLYSNNNCPSCGNELPTGMGDIARCTSCETISNSPEFDWILNEITQSNMYYKHKGDFKYPYKGLNDHISSYDLCKQYLEDVASSAFVHLRMADALNKFEGAQRFVTKDYLQKVKDLDDEVYLYYRYYISKLNLIRINYLKEERLYEAEFLVKEHFKRVQEKDGELVYIDTRMNSQERIVAMRKSVDAFKNKFLVHQHRCSSCGGPIKNTQEINCGFCGTELASTEADWVITGVFTVKDA